MNSENPESAINPTHIPHVQAGDPDSDPQEQQKDLVGTGPKYPCDPNSHWVAYSDRLRQIVQHENELVNNRIHWLVLFNGLAFAATGVLWGKEHVFWILIVLGFSGVVGSVACFLALHGGRYALEKVNRKWNSTEELRKEVGLIAPISARPHAAARNPDEDRLGAWIDNWLTRHLHPITAIPLVIILVWCVLVGNLFLNGQLRSELKSVPVKLTHRGIEIEVKESEDEFSSRNNVPNGTEAQTSDVTPTTPDAAVAPDAVKGETGVDAVTSGQQPAADGSTKDAESQK